LLDSEAVEAVMISGNRLAQIPLKTSDKRLSWNKFLRKSAEKREKEVGRARFELAAPACQGHLLILLVISIVTLAASSTPTRPTMLVLELRG
jgi:hypothetical protein